jgi:hypothetical protein
MMSGAAGSIAALAHGPGRIEETKANFFRRADPGKPYRLYPAPPALKLKTHLKAASCARNFFIAAAANGLTTPVCKASSE